MQCFGFCSGAEQLGNLGQAIFFSLFFPKHLVNFALVLWRLLTFYLPIVIGLIATVIEKRRAGVPREALEVGAPVPDAPDLKAPVPDVAYAASDRDETDPGNRDS